MHRVFQSSRTRILVISAVFLLSFQFCLFLLNANYQKTTNQNPVDEINVYNIRTHSNDSLLLETTELSNSSKPMQTLIEEIATEAPSGPVKKLALICILHMDKLYQKRALIREYYQLSKPENMDLLFVLGRPSEEYKLMVEAEQLHFKDLLILDIEENLERGKTLDMFEYLAKTFGKNSNSSVTYDIVMKTDDDSFIFLKRLARYLEPLNKTELYGGVLMGVGGADPTLFMQGRGYFLSWDLVEWLPTSPFPRTKITGYEDANVGRWILHYGLKSERWHQTWDFIDIRNTKVGKNTILIHPVKDSKTWIELGAEAIKYDLFN